MTQPVTEDVVPRRSVAFVALLVGAGVAVVLGVLGRAHDPSYESLPALGFSSAGTFKSWTTSLVAVLALGQLVSALWLYGRLPGVGRAPSWLGTAHRVSGSLAFLLSLPVAFYCLYGFGFARLPWSLHTLAHSLAGCAFYGAFAAKVIFVHSKRTPGWGLPVAGGLMFTAVVLLWFTGAWWFFGIEGVHT